MEESGRRRDALRLAACAIVLFVQLAAAVQSRRNNVGAAFHFLPVRTNPPGEDGRLVVPSLSAPAQSVTAEIGALDGRKDAPLARFTLGVATEANESALLAQQGESVPFLFAEHFLMGSKSTRKRSDAHPALQIGLAMLAVNVVSEDDSIVYQKNLDELQWSGVYIEDRVSVDAALGTNVAVLTTHSLDHSVSVSLAVAAKSLREFLRGGVVSSSVSHIWVRVEGIDPAALAPFSNRKIQLQCALCTVKAPRFVESPSKGREPFVSFQEKLSVSRKERKKLKDFGFLSWNWDIKPEQASTFSPRATKLLSAEDLDALNAFAFQKSSHSCRGVSFTRVWRPGGDVQAVVWGLGLGFGALPPFVESWKWSVIVVLVGALGLGVTAIFAVVYIRRMRRLEQQAALEDDADANLRFEFPESLRRRYSSVRP